MKNKFKYLLAAAFVGLAYTTLQAASNTYIPLSATLSANATGYNQSGLLDYFLIKGTTVTINAAAGVAVLGTNTNDSASTGFYGEYISSVTAGYVLSATSNNALDMVAITLTAGDWDVTAICNLTPNGATVTDSVIGIGTTAGNNSTGLVTGDTAAEGAIPTSAHDATISVPSVRKSISGTTTYYFKTIVTFTAATPKIFGRLFARRVR